MSVSPADTPPELLAPLLLVDDDFHARLGSVVSRLCVGLIDHAARTHVITGPQTVLGDLLGPLKIESIPGYSILPPARRLDAVVAGMPGLQPNLIHVMGRRMIWAAQRIRRRFPVPLVYHLTALRDVAALRRLPHEGELHVLAASAPLRDEALAQAALPEHHVHLVRPGVRPFEKPVRHESENGALTAFVWAHEKTAASVVPVFAALHRLLENERRVLMFVVGAGRLEPALRRAVHRLKLRSHVTFVAERESSIIGTAGEDVLILPRPPADLGMPTLIAMAGGVVVLAGGAGIHDCIRDDETALLFTAGNAENLAAQLDRLIRDRPLARRLSDEGREYVRSHHQVSVMIDKIVEVYRLATGLAARAPAAFES
jgi:glycosyltransferase involved in cell wall biosynthesis